VRAAERLVTAGRALVTRAEVTRDNLFGIHR